MAAQYASIEAPAEAALAPFRWYAAAMAAAEEGLLAFAQAATAMNQSVATLYAQQAQLALDSAEAAARVIINLPVARNAVGQGLAVTKALAQRFEEDPRWACGPSIEGRSRPRAGEPAAFILPD